MPKEISDIKVLVSFIEESVDEDVVLQNLSEILLKALVDNNHIQTNEDINFSNTNTEVKSLCIKADTNI